MSLLPRACVLAGDQRSQLAAAEFAEQTGAVMCGLARHALNAAALTPSVSAAKPSGTAVGHAPSSSRAAKDLAAFVDQVAGELRCPQSQYGGLGAAMAAEACVAAAAAALGAAAGTAHRNPYHEILAGEASIPLLSQYKSDRNWPLSEMSSSLMCWPYGLFLLEGGPIRSGAGHHLVIAGMYQDCWQISELLRKFTFDGRLIHVPRVTNEFGG